MAEITRKALEDVVSHNFLINQAGFVNITNSNPNPCYRDANDRIIELPKGTIVTDIIGLSNIYYYLGFNHGVKHSVSIMINNSAEFIKETIKI